MHALSKLFAIIVATMIMFIAPLLNLANSEDDVIQTVVYKQTVDFKNSICTQGKITQAGYMSFVNSLDATGNLYDIEITVSHQTVVPKFGEASSVVGTKKVDVCTYTDEILEKVYQTDGIYELDKGDTISITVTNKTATMGQNLRVAFMRVPDYGTRICATAGGIVRDEFF